MSIPRINTPERSIGQPSADEVTTTTVLTMNLTALGADFSAVDLPFQPLSQLPLSYRMCT
jgi:hypothetical protein